MGSQVDLDDLTPDDPTPGDKPVRSKPKSSRTSSRKEGELRGRLADCFDRIAAALEERGDEELASIIREDAPIMSQGLVSLTRPLTVLRTPLVVALAIVEPVMAFGRIFRVVAGRFAERRARIIAEQEAAAEEAQREQHL